jgi:hypothetical protein
VSFVKFCEMMFRRYPHMDGNQLLSMCEVAYKEIIEEEGEYASVC